MEVAVRLLNGMLMIAMAIALGIYLARRTGQRWKLFLVGAVLFVASQVLHIPFNLMVLNPILERLGFGDGGFGVGLVVGALLLGLSAGLFEEVTRWLGLRHWIKDARSWNSALMYGAGWGGIEAILLGLVVLWALTQAILYQQGILQGLHPARAAGAGGRTVCNLLGNTAIPESFGSCGARICSNVASLA